MKARLRQVVLVLCLALGLVVARRAAGSPELDRTTPRRTMAAFLMASEARDWEAASMFLDLRSLPPETRAMRGRELAEQLYYVLRRSVWIEPEQLSNDPKGNAGDGLETERVGMVHADGADVPITLAVLEGEGQDHPWAFSASTVARIPRLYEEHGPGWVESRMPASLRLRAGGLSLWQWLGLLLAVCLAYAIGRSSAFVLTRALERITTRTRADWDDELVAALRRPSRFLFGVFSLHLLLDPLALSAAAMHVISRLLEMISIGAVAWMTIGVVDVLSSFAERWVTEGKGVRSADLLAVRTQVRVLRRVVNVAIGIVAIALMLTQFEIVRNVGVSLLASAGVAGVVLGFAAQRTFGSLIAGLQLSFTQPIRIGDVVVVEKEQGTIEEVTLTFVVVRLWDDRRLIVPMTRFLEQPFENWTKVSPDLHGTVFLYVDWTLPIDDLRAELDRILDGNGLWDGRTKSVAVTGTTERTLEVRILVSALDPPTLGLLRHQLRERLVAWLQRHEGGKYLPHVRLGGPSPIAEAASRRL